MTRQLEAVFTQGVLRPVEPLSLTENQHVIVTISDVPTPVISLSRDEELNWLQLHQNEYRGQWVALQGSELLSFGAKAIAVREAAGEKGFDRPLMIRVPHEPDLPSAGRL